MTDLPTVVMKSRSVESLHRFYIFGREAEGDERKGHNLLRQVQQLPKLLHAVFSRIDAAPDRAQPFCAASRRVCVAAAQSSTQ
jgi:hypothetical protein